MKDTYFDALTRWEIPFTQEELLVSKESVPAMQSSAADSRRNCIHGINGDADYSRRETPSDVGALTFLFKCRTEHFAPQPTPEETKTRRTADLLFIAAYLSWKEDNAAAKLLQSFPNLKRLAGTLPFFKIPENASIEDKLPSKFTTKLYSEFSGLVDSSTGERLLNLSQGILNSLPLSHEEIFLEACGLKAPKADTPLAYFEMKEVDELHYHLLKNAYGAFRNPVSDTEHVVVAELPISFLDFEEDQERVTVGGGEVIPRFFKNYDPRASSAWGVSGRGSTTFTWRASNEEAPLLTKVYPRGNPSAEVTETLYILGREMPFTVALMSAEALAASD